MIIVTKAVQNAIAHCDIDYNDIIDELLDTTTLTVATEPAIAIDSPVLTAINAKRERLVALAACGHAKKYLGRDLTSEPIDSMADEHIQKLYARYELRIGAAMTRTPG